MIENDEPIASMTAEHVVVVEDEEDIRGLLVLTLRDAAQRPLFRYAPVVGTQEGL